MTFPPGSWPIFLSIAFLAFTWGEFARRGTYAFQAAFFASLVSYAALRSGDTDVPGALLLGILSTVLLFSPGLLIKFTSVFR